MKLLLFASWALVMRDYRVRFRRAIFGIFWFFLPLFTLLAMAMFLGKDIGLYSSENANTYFLQLVVGLIFWQLLADTWLEPLRLARRANMLLRNIPFDTKALLGAGMLSSLVSFTLKLPILIGIFLYFDYPVTSSILFLPFGLFCLIAIGMTLACLIVPLSLGLIDVRYVMPYVQMSFLLATPIFYTQPDDGVLYWINTLNPFTYLVIPVRDLVLGKIPTTITIVVIGVISIVLLFLSLIYFENKAKLAIGYIGR